MTPDHGTGRRSRTARLLGWSVVGVVLCAVLAYLVVAGLGIWTFGHALPSHRAETITAERELNRRAAEAGERSLVAAAADGELTDAEIREAVGPVWSARSTSTRLTIEANFPDPGEGPHCYTFTLTLPLGPGVTAGWVERPDCREVTAVPGEATRGPGRSG